MCKISICLRAGIINTYYYFVFVRGVGVGIIPERISNSTSYMCPVSYKWYFIYLSCNILICIIRETPPLVSTIIILFYNFPLQWNSLPLNRQTYLPHLILYFLCVKLVSLRMHGVSFQSSVLWLHYKWYCISIPVSFLDHPQSNEKPFYLP